MNPATTHPEYNTDSRPERYNYTREVRQPNQHYHHGETHSDVVGGFKILFFVRFKWSTYGLAPAIYPPTVASRDRVFAESAVKRCVEVYGSILLLKGGSMCVNVFKADVSELGPVLGRSLSRTKH